jgi:hypothetical protein
MDKAMLHQFIDECWDKWHQSLSGNDGMATTPGPLTKTSAMQSQRIAAIKPPSATATSSSDEPKETKKIDGVWVTRTKSSGDRVYCLDDKTKTYIWVESPQMLESLGFEFKDVVDITDGELSQYKRTSPTKV